MSSRRLRARLTVAVLILPLLGACGGGDDEATLSAPGTGATSAAASAGSTPTSSPAGGSSGGGGAADPCSLLTVAEVSAAVGGTVAAGVKAGPEGPLGLATCIWATPTVPPRTFQIGISTDDGITVDGYSAAKLYDDTLKQVPATPAGGIGDKAAFSDNLGYVLKGDVYMNTSVAFGTSDTAKTALRDLTAKAAGRL